MVVASESDKVEYDKREYTAKPEEKDDVVEAMGRVVVEKESTFNGQDVGTGCVRYRSTGA